MVPALKIPKAIWSLVAALAACLAFGWWIQGRLLVSSATWVAEQRLQQEDPSTPPAAAGEQSLTADDVLSAISPVGAIVFCWTLVLQAGVAYLILSRLCGEHARKQTQSDEESAHRTKDLLRTRDAVIFGLAKLAESRDADTGHHLERIALYSTRLASALNRHPQYRSRVSNQFVKLIGVSSALHDIGKVGLEDSILLKPGRLTPSERNRMQSHAQRGAECIHNIELRLGNSNFLQMAHEIALCHHERWDGTGYPNCLSGEEIPLAARIVAIADVYDALSSRRVYKAPFSHEKCVDVIRDGAGKQFDPHLVEVFLKIESQFYEIVKKYPEAMDFELSIKDREPEHLLTAQQAQILISNTPLTESSLCPQAAT